ncbi:MAG: glycosyltransferase family 4 protein [Desulfobacterales bacterium]
MTSNRKKIAVVVPKYGLVGGGERFVFELTERLANVPGYEIHVFSNKWRSASDHITFHKIPIITFPKWLTSISFAYLANRKIAKMDFDLIHSHDRVFKSNVVTLHSIPHRTWVRDIRKKRRLSLFDHGTTWTEKQMYKYSGCQMFLPVSNLVKIKVLETFQIDEQNIRVIHPGVDVERFQSDNPHNRKEIRQAFGISESDFLILFVGMNFEVKGLDSLLSAIALLKSAYDNNQVKVLVVGKGNTKKYKALAQKLGIGEQLIFSGIQNDIEKIYPAGDILVMLSKFDTFGMVVTEAMAASLPVIISETVGAKDLVIQGENGFVVDREDIDMISSKINFMLNKQKRLEMGERAHQTALNNTWEKMTLKVLNVYEGLLG